MKNVSKILLATTLASLMGLASAHSQNGAVGSTKNGNAATDIYTVSCYNDGAGEAAKLWYRVKDLAPVLAPVISAQAGTGGSSADTKDGDTIFSTAATTSVLNAQKKVISVALKIMKSASTVKGSESYVAEFHCQTAGNVHTGTNWTMTQNQ